MKTLKLLPVTLAVAALANSALALPTLVVSDNGGGLSTVPVTSASGAVTYTSADAFWNIVISVATSYPPESGQGTITDPVMDLSVTASSPGGATGHDLTVYFGSDGFGPSASLATATISGHIIEGPGEAVTYTTFINPVNLLPGLDPNQIPPGSIVLTTSGVLPGPVYTSSVSDALNLASPYSLEQVVTITGGDALNSYSLDSGLQVVPESSTSALMLLGGALSWLALFRKRAS